ncbi:MAG: ABC transporter permease subunit [Alteromonadaceae bacterium]|nr:ABC transporter permease subunit [Alteromonadaceae bacterium]
MLGTLGRYFNLFFITLFILVGLSFVLAFFFPGDPVFNLTGMSLEQLPTSAYTKALADERWFVAFWYYVQSLLDGSWGISTITGLDLFAEVSTLLPATIELTAYATIVALFVGIPLGFWCGLKHHRKTDYALMSISMLMSSFPIFWLSLLLILVVSLQLGWLPMSGRLSLLYDIPHFSGFILLDIYVSDHPYRQEAFMDALRHMILPTLSVAFLATAVFLRTTRRAVVDVLEQDYIAAAQTRGIPFWKIFLRHIMRNALLAVLPLLAVQVSTLVTNVMIVETITEWPGIGDWLIQAIYERDYSAIRIGMLVVSTVVVFVTLLIECLSKLFDPTQEQFS